MVRIEAEGGGDSDGSGGGGCDGDDFGGRERRV